MARGDRAKRERRGSRARVVVVAEEEKRARDLINQLPEECLSLIFGFLPLPRDRCSCSLVSKKWLRVQAQMKHSELRSQQQQQQQQQEKEEEEQEEEEEEEEGGASLPTKKISRCLDMEEANDIRLAAMAIGIRYQGVLTELSIRECLPSLRSSSRAEGITDYGLIVISQACPDLRSLTLWNCTKIGDKGIASVADCCTSLEKFNLSNSPLITDDGLPLIANGCPNLSSLILDSCPSIGNRSLEAFVEHSTKLKLFILEKCRLVDDSAILSMLTKLPELRMLKIGSMEVGDAVMEAIGRHKQLRTLHLEKVRGITEGGYCWMIGENENLQSLSLNCCRGLPGKSFGQRTANRNVFVGLKKLAIKNCRTLTERDLVELTKSTASLSSLTLEKLEGITCRGLVEVLSNCSRTLRKLSLLKCHLMGAGGQQQSDAAHHPPLLPRNFPVLRTVRLNQCHGIGDGFLVGMGWAFKQVGEVGLVLMDSITDRGILGFLDKLGSNNNITKLDLSGCRSVTDRSLLAIARQCQELEELDMSRCMISDQGVEWLASGEGPRWLQALSLNGCTAITDKSLEALEARCLSLESLSVFSCPGISPEAITSFRETCLCNVSSSN